MYVKHLCNNICSNRSINYYYIIVILDFFLILQSSSVKGNGGTGTLIHVTLICKRGNDAYFTGFDEV